MKIANRTGRAHANLPDLNLGRLRGPEFWELLGGGDEITCHITGKINRKREKKKKSAYFFWTQFLIGRQTGRCRVATCAFPS